MTDFGGVVGRGSIGEDMQDEPHVPVGDVDRAAVPGEPPVEGAQWDEMHRRWEHWDEAAQRWIVVGDSDGDGVDPEAENPLPALLARELLLAGDLDEEHGADAVDVDRAAEPDEGPPGAQWNEVLSRWERWDDASGAWVKATDDP